MPTAYGQLFVEHARTVVNEMQRAKDSLQALRGLARGKVTFGITANFEGYLIPKVLGRLMKDNPAISIFSVTGFYEDLAVKVRAGELDFAFALLPPQHGHITLVEESVLPVTYHVYAPVSHPLARRREVSLADLSTQTWIIPDQPAHRTYERLFEMLGFHAPPAVLKTPSIPLMLSMLRNASVVGLFPDHLVQDTVRRGEVVRLRVLGLPEKTYAAIVTRKNAVVGPAAVALMEAIRNACHAIAGDAR